MMFGAEGVIGKACNINNKGKFMLIAQLGYDMDQCALFLLHWESLDSY